MAQVRRTRASAYMNEDGNGSVRFRRLRCLTRAVSRYLAARFSDHRRQRDKNAFMGALRSLVSGARFTQSTPHWL
jgi:hypothetical protein